MTYINNELKYQSNKLLQENSEKAYTKYNQMRANQFIFVFVYVFGSSRFDFAKLISFPRDYRQSFVLS